MGYTNQFNLEVGTTLNTKNVPVQLQQLNAQLQKSTSSTIQLPVVVNANSGITTLKNFVKEVNIYKDKLQNTFKEVKIIDPTTGEIWKNKDKITQVSSAIQTLTTETHKWTNTKGEINTWTTSVDSVGKTITTRVKESIDSLGNITTETSKWGQKTVEVNGQIKSVYGQIGDTIRNTKEIVKEMTTSTTTQIGQIEDLGHTYQGLITTTEKVSSNGEYLRTVISKYTDEMGRAVVKTEQFDKMGNQVATTMRKIGEAAKVKDTKASTFIDEKGVKTITEFVDGVATAKTVVSQYKNKLGELVTETKKYEIEEDNLGKTQEKLVSINTKTKQSLIDERKEKAKLLNETVKLIDEKNKLKQTQERLNKALVSTTTNKSRGKVTQFGDTSGKEYDAVITKIGQIDSAGKITIKTIEEFTNSLGQLVQQIRITDEKGTKLAEDSISISNAFDKENEKIRQQQQEHEKLIKETADLIIKKNELKQAQEKLNNALVSKKTTTTKGTVTQFGDNSGREYKALITTIEEIDSSGKKTIKTIQEFTNAQGQLVKQTRTTDGNLKKIAEDEIEIGKSAEKANHGVKNLGWTLSDAFSRLANFYLASLPLRAMQTLITETITTVKEFDSTLIEFRKVSDLAGDSLTKYVAKLAEMGEVTGSTMQAMVEASTEFRKSGFSDEDSAKLASVAEMYRNIADEEISAAESASFIIAQMKAFNIEADQAEHIIDSVNEVANNFSVSSADLAKNLGNMSAIMAINNVSMEEQIGMLTGVTEITRNASSASRGLVMVSSRLTQVLDDTSSTGKKLTKIYSDLGIKLKDEEGQLRSHYDILGDLADKWDSLSENEQKYIALTSAGARQQQNFVSLMENWGQVAKATATAYNSLGSAQKENEKVMDSIAKKVEVIKSQFQQLVIGDGSLQSIAKTILDIGIAILKFANDDVGQAAIGMTLFTVALYGASQALKTGLLASLIDAVKGFMAFVIQEGIATTTTEAFGLAVKALTKVIMSSPLVAVGLVIAGVTALCAIIDRFVITLDEAKEKLNELTDSIKQSETNLENYKKSLSDIKDELDKLDEKSLNITSKEEAEQINKERNELEQLSSELERQIKLETIKLAQEKELAEIEAKRALTTSAYHHDVGSGHALTTESEALDLAAEKYRNLRDELENLKQEQIEVAETKGIDSRAYQKLTDDIAETNEEINKTIATGNELATSMATSAESLTSLDDATVKLKEDTLNQVDIWTLLVGEGEELNEVFEEVQEGEEETGDETEDLEKKVEELADSLGITATELEGLRERFDDITLEGFLSNLADIKQKISDTNTVIDNLQDALSTASTALEEYNENGYLTIDTFQSLMSISAQYLTALINENGQLEINQTTMGKLIDKLKEEKVHELQAAETADILAYAQGDVAEMSSLAQTALYNAGVSAQNAGQKAASGASGFWSLADAISAANDAAQGKTHITRNQGIEAIHNAYSKLANEISKVKVNTTAAGNAATKAGKKGAGAAKSANDATKELNKTLEETKSKYEKVITWIKKQYDKKTDSIKDAKDAATDAIEKEIKALEKEKDTIVDGLKDKKDALEDEKDAILDGIEAEIKALEDSKKARQDYWDAQIDALKKANDARKDAIELQEKLDALERARNTKVKIYKEGQGFVYDVDQTKVAEAQKALDEYLSEKAYEDELARLEALKDAELDNFEKRIDALNDYKDKRQDALEKEIEALDNYIDELEKKYDEQIDALKEHKDAVEEQYDAEIKMYEDYKQQFEDMVNAYEEQQNKLLAQQLTGIDFENDNWMTRLDNLAEFVRKYNELQKQLNTGNTSVTNDASMKSGGGGSSSKTATYNPKDPSDVSTYNPKGSNYSSSTVKSTSNNSSGNNRKEVLAKTKVGLTVARLVGALGKHASGIGSIKDDEIAIVGENPNKEIVLGSKINNGELMALNKGAGVVNADSSNTLASMLNQVGKFGSSGFGSGNGTLNNNINNDTLTINGVTIEGSQINDPQTFVNGLLNLKSEALQRAYRHR